MSDKEGSRENSITT